MIKAGTQVIYVPLHAEKFTGHPDCEEGFVTSAKGDTVFCRFWSKANHNELKTKANSEGCDKSLLVFHATRNNWEVWHQLEKIRAEERRREREKRIAAP